MDWNNQHAEISVFDRINSDYYDFTASEKKLADYILAHKAEISRMSQAELAEASDVAEATASRFCRRLGYSGFSDFKMATAVAVLPVRVAENPLSGEINESDSFSEMAQKLFTADVEAISQTLELINEKSFKLAADMIEEAGQVLCMGQGGSMVIADEAAHLFSTCHRGVFAIPDNHFQVIMAANMLKDDVLLYFSYSGATTDMFDTLAAAKKRGAKIILITRFPNSPGAEMADVTLLCGSNESPLQLGSAAAKLAQIFLIDVLFSELSRRRLNDCRAARRRTAEALTSKHL